MLYAEAPVSSAAGAAAGGRWGWVAGEHKLKPQKKVTLSTSKQL